MPCEAVLCSDTPCYDVLLGESASLRDWSSDARVARGGRASRLGRYATSATVKRSACRCARRCATTRLSSASRVQDGGCIAARLCFDGRVARGGRAARLGRCATSATVERLRCVEWGCAGRAESADAPRIHVWSSEAEDLREGCALRFTDAPRTPFLALPGQGCA